MRIVTDKEVLNGKNDLEMIRRPHLWAYPFLPLKKPGLLQRDFDDPRALGVLVNGAGGLRVFVGNMFLLRAALEDPSGVRWVSYGSPEAVLADGWVVD